MTTRNLGARVPRVEDPRLLRGEGIYVDDVDDRGALHVAFLRANVAHAKIARLDVEAARNAHGVRAVFTADDLGDIDRPLPQLIPHPDLTHPRTQLPLARDKVVFVGETIAMVVAEDRYLAEDAVDLIEIDYEPLDVIVDLEEAAGEGAPLVHADVPGNVACHNVQVVGDPDAAFEEADVIIKERFSIERSAGMPMEGRGVVARWNSRDKELTVWDSTQAPVSIRGGLASIFDIPESKVRVITPQTGGGFGTKVMMFYPEEVLIPWAAIHLDEPIKWTEDRREHFLGSNHERKQIHYIELAAKSDGTVIGLRDHFLHDTGAYIPYGIAVAQVAAGQIGGPYRIPNIRVSFDAVYTNTMTVSPYRGAGRPHACMALEMAMEKLADELGIDRMELRRRNFIAPDEFPYARDGITFADGNQVLMDSADYGTMFDQVLDELGYEQFLEDQKVAEAEGRMLGLGLAVYVEGTGLGPYEGARINVHPITGKVHVAIGLSTQGQSHETAFAQIAADQLGVDPEDVILVAGDTAALGYGVGTFASRAAVCSGNAVNVAARKVREKALRLASDMLEADAEDLVMEDGKIAVKGAPGRAVSLKDVAIASNPLRYAFNEDAQAASQFSAAPKEGPPLAEGEEPGLHADGYYSPPGATWASGVHAAIVEIDPDTCNVEFKRYVCSHDCGVMINPTVVEGQVYGGIAQGLGGAYYERFQYDNQGQMLNASFMEFLMPQATELPTVEMHHQETPSPLNELGLKGVGEAGAIPVPSLFASAVQDALKRYGTRVTEVPLSPNMVHRMIEEGKAKKEQDAVTA